MKYTLGLKQLPFKQDPRQIIYVESHFHGYVNKLIMCHYKEICDYFSKEGYEFCYIPWIGRGDEYNYYAPYRRQVQDKVLMKSDFILDYMLNPENKAKIGPSLLYYHPDGVSYDLPEDECQFWGITIDCSSFDQSPDLRFVLYDIKEDIESFRRPPIRFQKVPQVQFHIEIDDEVRSSWRAVEEDVEYDADFFFDSESKRLIGEIRDRIEKLNKKGIKTYIIKQLLKEEDEKPSQMYITKDYRIFLPDYKNMEITMTPLPKAVFLLFLNHPEGILFKHLPDYQEELLEIYRKVKGALFNASTAKKSIEDVTDPLSNSINEKCARIREAFVSQFDEHLAKYYYVEGKRGEPKKIAIPRNLVKWE